MQETVNAAKQKVLQTQMQANRLKELNDIKGAKIEELRRQIDEEMEKEQMELQEFEKHLGELTNNFRDARYYYTKENVNQEIEQWRKQAEAARAVVLKEENTLKELTAKFHQLEVENKEGKDKINNKLEFGLTIEELELAVNVCEGINEEKKRKLRLTEQQLELELKRLEQAKSDGQRFAVSPLTTKEVTISTTYLSPTIQLQQYQERIKGTEKASPIP
ncbi:uncharacterized protein [Porites lutea]|uniref:uncharacterized protein n=1 Tax=Porites lutea TaxID=51062 RepID=UPI003CC5AFC8